MKNFHNGTMFRMASYFRHTGKLEILNVTAYWPGGSVTAPLGRPECGFNGEFCSPPGRKQSYSLVEYISVIILVGGSKTIVSLYKVTFSVLFDSFFHFFIIPEKPHGERIIK